MSEWEYKYCEKDGVEFWIQYFEGELFFDVDYKNEFLVLDLGDRLEVAL